MEMKVAMSPARAEGERLLQKVAPHVGSMADKDAAFVLRMAERLEREGGGYEPHPGQIFWLRDIAERVVYVEETK